MRRQLFTVRRDGAVAALIALGFGLVGAAHGASTNAKENAPPSAPSYLDQGWTAADREFFYSTSQGSRLMPLSWFLALRRVDTDDRFAGDQLARYGYLPRQVSASTPSLPVGFVADAHGDQPQVGLTCAACHTGEITFRHNGAQQTIRIDGAPASADFQQFLTDLDIAAKTTLSDSKRLTRFVHDVLGTSASAEAAESLRIDLAAWVTQFDAFMSASLPASHPWGPGRLDAFGMIFNRVAALDLNRPDNFVIADAPVSYPFLWNAHRQDKTQWTGSVPNGLFIRGLGRNTGEALGVFADFQPRKLNDATPFLPRFVRFDQNSVDFEHLEALEEKLATLKPPPWPRNAFGLKPTLAAQGEPIFRANCSGCHSDAPSSEAPGAWATTVQDVGTDPKLAVRASRTSWTGLYEGALPPPPDGAFGPQAPTTQVLKASVVGLLLDHGLHPTPAGENGVWRALRKDSLLGQNDGDLVVTSTDAVLQAKAGVEKTLAPMYVLHNGAGAAYEGRALHGVWATAPYLHNGSVPNLWELLRPPERRVATFDVGGRCFDPVRVGFVPDGVPRPNGRFVTGNRDAFGNSNQGHTYGTALSDAQKWALIEYMKTL